MNSVSEPPIVSVKPERERAPTFADVAMRVANDGPMYAAIALVGMLSLQGKATASEMVITALASLLARSWPRAVQTTPGHSSRLGLGVLPLLVSGTIFAKTLACAPPPAKSSSSSSPAPMHVHASIVGR